METLKQNSSACRAQFKTFVVVGVLLFLFNAPRANAFVAGDADTMIASYNSAFYFTNSGSRGYFRNTTADSTPTWFWGRANQMEMLLDIYERTTNSVYLTQFTNLYNGFVSDYGTSWTWNEYNDDIMWAVIACSRAYLKTGNTSFRDSAKNNFDACYARAWTTNLGGGLWWKYPTNTSKNACVNGPAAIAAHLLYQSYNDTNYLTKANDIFLWERATLVNTNTGQVYDSIYYTGTKDQTPITYNEGTYIGAANFLGYTNEAMLAANYTKNSMGSGGLLPNYDEDNDLGGFNGIFLRWVWKFMKDRNLQSTYQLWLQQNANAAWNVRRGSDNIAWSKWHQQTPSGTRYSFGCWGSVLALQIVPPTQTPGATAIFLNTSDIAGTSSFESGLNWLDSTPPSSLHNYVVSNAVTLRAPQDGLHHSFAGSSLTLSNGAILALKNSSGGKVISIGTDLFLDNGQVADWAGNSSELSGKATLRSGGGIFDPQGNVFTVSSLIGGPGFLMVSAGASSALGGTVIVSGYNTYTGGTVINAPHTLQLSSDGALGNTNNSLSFSNTVERGYGTLNLNGINLSIGNLTGAGGKIINNASGTTNTLTISNSNASGGNFQGVIANNTSGTGIITLFKVGTGTVQLSAINTYTGGTTISGGVLQLGDTTRNGSVSGSITNNAALVFANPFTLTCTNFITGTGSLTKISSGKLILSGAISHSGATTIGAGILAIIDPAALTSSSTIAISNATSLDVSGKADQTLTLNSGQFLRGSGSVIGKLTVLPGAIVKPGDAIGTLTIQSDVTLGGKLVMEINRTNVQTSDRLASTAGNISGGGTLIVTNLGPALVGGDAFQLFNQPVSGFSSISLPSLPVGYAWADNLASSGIIRVVSTNPAAMTFETLTANQFSLSWPADHLGWRLQVQMNDLGTGLSTDWIDVAEAAETNQWIVPILLDERSVFFRLVYP